MTYATKQAFDKLAIGANALRIAKITDAVRRRLSGAAAGAVAPANTAAIKQQAKRIANARSNQGLISVKSPAVEDVIRRANLAEMYRIARAANVKLPRRDAGDSRILSFLRHRGDEIKAVIGKERGTPQWLSPPPNFRSTGSQRSPVAQNRLDKLEKRLANNINDKAFDVEFFAENGEVVNRLRKLLQGYAANKKLPTGIDTMVNTTTRIGDTTRLNTGEPYHLLNVNHLLESKRSLVDRLLRRQPAVDMAERSLKDLNNWYPNLNSAEAADALRRKAEVAGQYSDRLRRLVNGVSDPADKGNSDLLATYLPQLQKFQAGMASPRVKGTSASKMLGLKKGDPVWYSGRSDVPIGYLNKHDKPILAVTDESTLKSFGPLGPLTQHVATDTRGMSQANISAANLRLRGQNTGWAEQPDYEQVATMPDFSTWAKSHTLLRPVGTDKSQLKLISPRAFGRRFADTPVKVGK